MYQLNEIVLTDPNLMSLYQQAQRTEENAWRLLEELDKRIPPPEVLFEQWEKQKEKEGN